MFPRLTLMIGVLLLLLGGTSCEQNATIKPHHSQQSLVVEGKIESGEAPTVILTHSMDYFSTIKVAAIEKMFVHNAKISVSSGNRVVQLIEKEVDTLLGTKYYYYTPKHPRTFIGTPGESYTLHIETAENTYQAQTTIPLNGFSLDSVWWAPAVKGGKPDSGKALLMAKIYDPPQRGNYARYFTKRNREPFYAGLASVAEDNITNGKLFNFQLSRGVPKSEDLDLEDFGYFLRGDTVTLKFCNIDKATYQFWSTWEYAWSNTGNPFSTPTEVKGNISGALGYWGGYQVQYKRIIIPK